MKLSIYTLALLFYISIVFSYTLADDYTDDYLIKEKDKSKSKEKEKEKEKDTKADTETTNAIVHGADDAHFKLCHLEKGIEKCEYVYEDEINGKSECTDAIMKECPLHMEYDEKTVGIYCKSYYNQEKCDKLYKDGYKSLPICKDKNQKYLDILYENFKSKYVHTKLLCTKDDDGNLCPFTSYNYLRYQDMIDTDKFWKYIHQSCKSSSCVKVFSDALESEPELYTSNELKLLNEGIKYLKSDQCKSHASLNYNHHYNTLWIILAGLLFSILF